jgi:DNA-binding transcriptional ArsR family regulator
MALHGHPVRHAIQRQAPETDDTRPAVEVDARLLVDESVDISRRERSVGELVELLGEPQTKVSNHLACLRWCGFVTTRREHRTIHYRLADPGVVEVIELGRALLHDNEEHVAACRQVDRRC